MSGQYCVDANIFLAAWYKSYPRHIFSSLWQQISECRNDIILIKSIFDEILHRQIEKYRWQRKEKNIRCVCGWKKTGLMRQI